MLRNRLFALLILSIFAISNVIYANEVKFENQAPKVQNQDSARAESLDSVSSDKVNAINAQSQSDNADTTKTGKIENNAENSEENDSGGSGFLSTLLLIALIAACIYLYRKIQILETCLNKELQCYRKGESELKEDIRRLDEALDDLKSQMKQLQTKNESLGNNHVPTSIIESSIITKDEVKEIMPPKPKKMKKYANIISIDDYEKLYVQVRSLKDDASLLFMFELDNENGKGTYTINPNIKNPMDYISELMISTDGLTENSGANRIAVELEGELQRVENKWMVIRKLKLVLK